MKRTRTPSPPPAPETQTAFLARGLASAAKAHVKRDYRSADSVLTKLAIRLALRHQREEDFH